MEFLVWLLLCVSELAIAGFVLVGPLDKAMQDAAVWVEGIVSSKCITRNNFSLYATRKGIISDFLLSPLEVNVTTLPFPPL